MNPAFLLGTAFNIEYWHRKYHSGTICKGVSNPQTSNALSGCEKEEIPKWVWRRYRQRIRMKPKKSFRKMKGKSVPSTLGSKSFIPQETDPNQQGNHSLVSQFLTLRQGSRDARQGFQETHGS